MSALDLLAAYQLERGKPAGVSTPSQIHKAIVHAIIHGLAVNATEVTYEFGDDEADDEAAAGEEEDAEPATDKGP